MLLALAGISSTGAAYAVAVPEVDETRSVQQQSTCTGVVKDAAGETVIGASVVVKGTANGTITGLDGDFSLSGVKKGISSRFLSWDIRLRKLYGMARILKLP